MKFIKKILIYYLVVILVFLSCKVDIKASSIQPTFVLNHNGPSNSDYYQYTDDTDSLLPDGSNLMVFYKWADGKCWYTSNSSLAIQTANRQGFLFKPTKVGEFASNFDIYTRALLAPLSQDLDTCLPVYRQIGNDLTCIGLAISDLSGCHLNREHGGTGGSFGVPSDYNNVVHSYLDDVASAITPDYINIPTITENLAKINLYSGKNGMSETVYDWNENAISSISGNEYYFGFQYSSNTSNQGERYYNSFYYKGAYNSYGVGYYTFDDFAYLAMNDSSAFDNFCNRLGLTVDKNTIAFSDLLIYSFESIYCYPRKSNGSQCSGTLHRPDGNISISDKYFELCNYSYGVTLLPYSNNGWVTLYKSTAIVPQINNNTYAPDYRISSKFNDYNYTTNNSYQTTINQTDNSSQNNDNIYNQSNTEINNNTTTNNNYYNEDNSQTIINNITNIYYGDSNGGDGDDDDDDDSIIWDKLLEAIIGFFKKIGELLAAVLTGIIELFGQILEAITNITTSFTGITDFLSNVFSFMPSELISVITLALTTALLVSLIKIFRK